MLSCGVGSASEISSGVVNFTFLRAQHSFMYVGRGLAVREASLAFIESWEAKLGFKYVDGETTVPWQSLKALSHRYAEGWLRDGYWLRPIDQLTANLRNVLTKFLDNAIEWGGKPVSDEAKLDILDGLKKRITEPLAGIAETEAASV
jgi:hypothetical protein